MQEIWKDIPNYEKYYKVSNFGGIFSLRNSRILKQYIVSDYYSVKLCNDNSRKIFNVHQLVAMAFLNHKPNGINIVVDHIDNNKLNNNLDNLQLITHRENISKDKFRYNYSSKYVGVCWDNKNKKWRSRIRINGSQKHLGYFINEIDAHIAYQNKLKEIQ